MDGREYGLAVSFNVGIARELSINAAVLFNELLFWSDKGGRADGWVYKSNAELLGRVPMSVDEIRLAYKKLADAGYIAKKIMKANGTPTTHYKILKSPQATVVEEPSVPDEIPIIGNPQMENGKSPNEILEIPKSIIRKQNNNTRITTPTLVTNVPNGLSTETQEFGNAEINEMFEYWSKTVGYPIDSKVKRNRYACSNLLKKRGKDPLLRVISGVAMTHADPFAPRISNFLDLESKWTDLIVWGRKQQTKQPRIRVIS